MERQGANRSTNIPLRQAAVTSGQPPITPMQSVLSVMSFNGSQAPISSAREPPNAPPTQSSSYIPLNPSSIGTIGSAVSGMGPGANASNNLSITQPFLMARPLLPTMDDAELAEAEQERADRLVHLNLFNFFYVTNIC